MTAFSTETSDSSDSVRGQLSAKKSRNINGFTVLLTELTVLQTSWQDLKNQKVGGVYDKNL